MPSLPRKIFKTQPEEDRQRSLFGEILDWMLAPLLLLWPMSIAITYLVAKSIANQPFDHALDDKILILSQQIKLAARASSGGINPATPASASASTVTSATGSNAAASATGSALTPSSASLFTPLPSSAKRILRADGLDNVYFQVTDAQRNLLDGDADFPFPDDIGPIGVVKFRLDTIHGTEIRVAYSTVNLSRGNLTLHSQGNTSGLPRLALIQVGETLEKRSQLANEIIKGVILPQFIILPIALTLIWLALARGLAPLIELQKRIRARDPEDLSPIISGHVPEEISPLVASFNEMLERLSLSIALQKRFIADAAHQLKTPLAGMRMQSELALRYTDQAEIARSLIQLSKSSQAATHLVNQLLSLARAENRAENGNASALCTLDLSELVRSVISEWVPNALNLHIDLGLEVPDHAVLIEGNALMLRELIANLVDNALHYTPSGESVTLRVLQQDHEPEYCNTPTTHHPQQQTMEQESYVDVSGTLSGTLSGNLTERTPEHRKAILEVEDHGIGISAEDQPHIFERFYRVPDNLVEGSGLGLAIVREIADQHNAEITLTSANESRNPAYPGALFRLAFPLSTVTPDDTMLTEMALKNNSAILHAIDPAVGSYYPPYSPPFFSSRTMTEIDTIAGAEDQRHDTHVAAPETNTDTHHKAEHEATLNT